MNIILIGLLTLIAVYVVAILIIKRKPRRLNVNSVAEKEKEKRLQKVRHFIDHHDEITNNMIEKLGVSDATAERYLDELEHEGLIHQVGKTGRSTYYEKNSKDS